MASVEIIKKDLSSQYPTWFQPVPGFKFCDGEGDPYLVIGWGGWRSVETKTVNTPLGQLTTGSALAFRPCALLCTYLYKGEWYMREVEDDIMKDASPGWSPDHEKLLGGWQ